MSAVSRRTGLEARAAAPGRRPAAEPGHAGRTHRRRRAAYLAEFLSDRRVVEIPGFIWKPLLHLVILRVRPARSAKKYAMIWGSEGSPLLAHSLKQKTLLMGYLGQRLKDQGLPSDFAPVELAMRYGNPGIADAFDRLRSAGCDRILAVPLFPQHSSSATAAALDAVFAHARRMRRLPGLRTIDCFHDDPGYIRALARNVNDYWMRHARPDRLVMSFHGLPRRSLDLGDAYHCQCHKTARLLATELGLAGGAIRRHVPVALRPRGMAQALYPGHPRAPGQDGVARVDVVCPGFVSDCLETLEEIGIEVKQAFLGAGGREFHAIPVSSTSIRTGSPPWSTWSWRISRAGSTCRRTPRRARRR